MYHSTEEKTVLCSFRIWKHNEIIFSQKSMNISKNNHDLNFDQNNRDYHLGYYSAAPLQGVSRDTGADWPCTLILYFSIGLCDWFSEPSDRQYVPSMSLGLQLTIIFIMD